MEELRSAAIEDGIADSLAYLGSDDALASIAIDPYWPKWHSPWWHMVLLHELGLGAQIPPRAIEAMAAGVDGLLHTFPIEPEETAGVDLHRDIACHCALGCMAAVLAVHGKALAWIEPWFVRYQMVDGGLSCDETAYRVKGECPSSMVGTVAPIEAMIARGDRGFVARGEQFLIARALVHGSPTVHNADERTSALTWRALTFPRFYFYDVLRGLAALVRAAEVTGHAIPRAVIAGVADELATRFPDGVVRIERNAHAERKTLIPTADRSPSPRAPATSFPFLSAVSEIGAPSEALTRQWAETRTVIARLEAAGQIT